jgi:spermidine/putrescine-binding protein
MLETPDSFESLIDKWGIAQFAGDLGINYSTANAMKQRNSVASKYWDVMLKKSRARGIRLSPAQLIAMKSQTEVRA